MVQEVKTDDRHLQRIPRYRGELNLQIFTCQHHMQRN